MATIKSSFEFSTWPPQLTNDQLTTLTLQATTYAISHGLLYLPPGYPSASPPPQAAIHAPLSLFPAPFPRNSFDYAQRLQRLYNVLYAKIAMDTEFLDEIMGAERGVGKVDKFIGELWKGWKALRDEGAISQPLHLGLFRSDYLLHSPIHTTDSESGSAISLKQVEFNTISVSFGCLSQRIAELHRYLLASTSYFGLSPHLRPENFPANNTIAGFAEGLAEAHRAYISSGGGKHSRVLFVVQPGERNVFDQRWLEYELLEKYSIHILRQTFAELIYSASVDPNTSLLQISLPSSPSSPIEISVVYYRSGYMPHEYPDSSFYATRFLLERSKAIKCPTIPLQLAGGKKVQEVLGRQGVVERFLGEKSKEEIKDVRNSFMDMWGLDEASEAELGSTKGSVEAKAGEKFQEPIGTLKARSEHLSLVLKPQREGGGNNVYKEDIPAFLDGLPEEEREAWIAMRLIEVPKGIQGWLVRAGSLNYTSSDEGKNAEEERAVKAEVVSELGVFGWALFGQDVQKIDERPYIEEKEVGWLVRTKGKDSNEGGVATGFSVLDSLILVD